MADQRLFASQEDALVQGGSGNDTIGNFTGKFSATTLKGVDGGDWIYLGNSETAITFTGVAKSAGSAGDPISLTFTRNGSNWSAGFQATDSITTAFTAGSLTKSLVFTALTNSGAETLQRSLVAGGAGNDTISFGQAISYFSGNTIGGGAGNDQIGTFNSGSTDTAGLINTGFLGTNVKGGKGKDTIEFNVSAAADGSGFLINGNSGADSIRFSAAHTDKPFSDAKLAGGKGNDSITYVAPGSTAMTVKGGAGSDQITIADSVKVSKSLIEADGAGQDGNDTIFLTLSAGSGNTIVGGQGNDSIVFSAMDASNKDLVKAGKGNDFIVINSSVVNFAGVTIQGGQGNDSISIQTAGTLQLFNTGLIKLGAGDDTVSFAQTLAADTAGMAGTTIEGGAGKDKITVSGLQSAGSATFLYSSLSDSTSAEMDTITFGYSASRGSAAAIGSAQVNFKISDDVTLANGSGNSAVSGATAQSGLVVFSSVDSDLETRVSKLDAAFTTTGTVAVFTVNGTDQFIFVQGGATDGVIKINDSALMSAGQFGRTSTIHASGSTFGF